METKEIINNEVVTIIKIDLGKFIEQKKEEIENIDREISSFQNRKEEILLELSNLLK